mmetsp:Transcript_6495/g.20461  ORF Transcript_6495/g.20461 Transcript_6495/m.20461 type:complete len:271 (+) Transcript_6495:648-1460(+)
MRCTSCFATARPRPVDWTSRAVLSSSGPPSRGASDSTTTYFAKTFRWCSGSMPQPVSRTSSVSAAVGIPDDVRRVASSASWSNDGTLRRPPLWTGAGGSGAAGAAWRVATISIDPDVVCLHAFDSRFSNTCRSRTASPTTSKRATGAPAASTMRVVTSTSSGGRIIRPTSRTTPQTSKGSSANVIAPSSMRRRSSTLFRTSDMCVEHSRADWTSSAMLAKCAATSARARAFDARSAPPAPAAAAAFSNASPMHERWPAMPLYGFRISWNT